MDDYREFPSEFELGAPEAATETVTPADAVAVIGTDERRMHVRAYNYWVSLLDGRDFPSIEDLEPGDINDFSPHSVLLDFTCGRDNPAIPYIGAAIREECGLDDDMRMIRDVPSGSLLSRLTDHYLQIIANRSPVGFEAEFINQRDQNICYRGILMPFSSDGDTIDFIYGVINWKAESESVPAQAAIVPAIEPPAAFAPEPEPTAADEDDTLELGSADDESEEFGPGDNAIDPVAAASSYEPQFGSLIGAFGTAKQPALPEPDEPRAPPRFAQPAPRAYDFDPADYPELDPGPVIELAAPELGPDAALADRLVAARETAEAAKAGEGRTRAALYQALALAYDFALAARADPAEYEELLAESGVKAQARAPMTPVVKLVFGVDYDKARLTEFAAALSFADRSAVEAGEFETFIAGKQGGLKALVAAERQARRPESRADDRAEAARSKLRSVPALSAEDFAAASEFSMVVMRRSAEGAVEPVAILADDALLERVLRKLA